MKDERSTDQEAHGPRHPYRSMPKSELKALAISAIREHRRLIEADEAVYAEWMRAYDDPTTPSSILKSLQDEYVARQERAEAQQHELSEILEVLGHVPDVALDCNESDLK
ncbi:transcriptional repressor TraM [Neorhizobium sp. T786]|uniref:transcriptional repressor TraM n=1 Tax=Pseudorhizobium xiangyangii TaxID=2883104 RepID=UPI001CFF611B|nr:transcriptional repressor TraM [Neorhizobium xiangyangii]MCB5204738.1 transcriptional repressor TraM [Neorhizobium xiangyangii]